jgi:hypothetical protein
MGSSTTYRSTPYGKVSSMPFSTQVGPGPQDPEYERKSEDERRHVQESLREVHARERQEHNFLDSEQTPTIGHATLHVNQFTHLVAAMIGRVMLTVFGCCGASLFHSATMLLVSPLLQCSRLCSLLFYPLLQAGIHVHVRRVGARIARSGVSVLVLVHVHRSWCVLGGRWCVLLVR